MAENQVYGENVNIVDEVGLRVLNKLFPETAGKRITASPLSIMRNFGNLGQQHYRAEYLVDEKPYVFWARIYTSKPQAYTAHISQARKAHLSSKFLGEKAGIIDVPKTAYFEDLPKWLFTVAVPGKTVREKLAEIPKESERVDLIMNLLDSQTEYQYRATNAVARMSVEDRTDCFWSRTVEEQARNYLVSWIKDKDTAEKVLNKFYLPLFEDAVLGTSGVRSINHGDLSDTNVIMTPDGRFVKIDHELKERNLLGDAGCFLSYLGDYEEHWAKIAEAVMSKNFSLLAAQRGLKLTKGLFQSEYYLTSEGRKINHFELSANVHHNALRRKQKKEKDGEDSTVQKRATLGVLNAYLNRADDFGLENPKLAMVKEYRKILEDYSIK